MIIDTHTHHTDRRNAIVNAPASDFKPLDGIFYSIGIHPWDIDKNNLDSLFNEVVAIATSNAQVVAIGECGLDALISTPLDVQIALMKQHIELSERLKKPLIIHCVRRTNEILTLHRRFQPTQAWIIHGFRSKASVLRPLLTEEGIFFSIGEKFNDETVKIIPEKRLLIETDESALSIEEIARKIAAARSITAHRLMDIVTENLNYLITSF